MKHRNENCNNRKGKRKMSGWIIALIIVAILGACGGIGWSFLEKEHKEARNLSIEAIDFSDLNDGIYIGKYAGGIYQWRANDVQVTVSSGTVTDIKLLSSSDPGTNNTQENVLYDSIIKKQSLQVDTISGPTLTSKAYLKAVENALIQAEK